jgi:hypothetical protein
MLMPSLARPALTSREPSNAASLVFDPWTLLSGPALIPVRLIFQISIARLLFRAP